MENTDLGTLRIRDPQKSRFQFRKSTLSAISFGAIDSARVVGLTHRFYKYPARFSPNFVSAVIESCSQPGDLVLDPFMGGGTTIVEAITRGRKAVGTDLNSLAFFVARVKTQLLSQSEREAINAWVQITASSRNYHERLHASDTVFDERTRNLSIPRARAIKKLIALSLSSLDSLPTAACKRFVRCIILNAAQWALNNRKNNTTLEEFRIRLALSSREMLEGINDLAATVERRGFEISPPSLFNVAASEILSTDAFSKLPKAKLVITSPPYPGIHVLYHRWQVDGRRETPAPYWIAGCMDGQGTHHYNFGSRHEPDQKSYFENVLANLSAVRHCMRDDGLVVQMLAFSDPRSQLPKYLRRMEQAGFEEIRKCDDESQSFRRIRRVVPSRAWHASLKGLTSSAQELVLVHRPV